MRLSSPSQKRLRTGIGTPPEAPSFFVLSLPRSLSTLVHHYACHMTGFRQPLWTSAGEILNLDRFVTNAGWSHGSCMKYVTQQDNPDAFIALTELLEQTARPAGFAYKDVVQPFVVSNWLRSCHPPARLIRLRRNVADVAYSMLFRKWYYPARLFPEARSRASAIVQGLLLASRALDSVPAETLDFEELIADSKPLQKAVQRLYPEFEIEPVPYLNDDFLRQRETILRRRKTKNYAKLEAFLAEAMKKNGPEPPEPDAPAPPTRRSRGQPSARSGHRPA